MVCLPDLRPPVRIAASPGKQHPLIMKAYVVHNGKFIVGSNLLKGSEKIVCCSHQQCAVLHRVLLISSQRGLRVFLGDAVKSLNERL